MTLRSLLALVLCGVAGVASAVVQPDKEHDPLLKLPTPPKGAWTAFSDLGPGTEVVAGVRYERDRWVMLEGSINMDQGPADGLEVLACLKDGKTHESLLRIDSPSGRMIQLACIAAFNFPTGIPADEGSGIPARGTPVRVRVVWKGEDGKAKAIDASCLVRDRSMNRGYPPLPMVYTGSRFLTVQEVGADGKVVRRDRYMLDNTRSIGVNYDEPDALLASPYPGANEDGRFEANSGLFDPAGSTAPTVGSRISMLIEKTELALTLELDDHGGLRSGDQVVDDERLAALLAASYGADAPADRLRAVGVRVAKGIENRQLDVAARARVMAAAAVAKAWVVPVFVLAGE
jgi:hypothetical protein